MTERPGRWGRRGPAGLARILRCARRVDQGGAAQRTGGVALAVRPGARKGCGTWRPRRGERADRSKEHDHDRERLAQLLIIGNSKAGGR